MNDIIKTNQSLDFSNKKILETLKKTVAKEATEEEFILFCNYCKSTGLNPFKKEIWFIKTDSGIQLMTGINGFYAIANNHPQFDGIEVKVGEANGKIVKAVARVWRKDRKYPFVAEAYFCEYVKPSSYIWKKMPRVMISKCAESMALRKAFPQELNGLYTKEEMPPKFEAEDLTSINEEENKKSVEIKEIAKETVKEDNSTDTTIYSYRFEKSDPEFSKLLAIARKIKEKYGGKYSKDTNTWDLQYKSKTLAKYLVYTTEVENLDTDENEINI